MHLFFRRVTLIFALVICLISSFQLFKDIGSITTEAVGAYGIATGLLTVAVGFYFKTRQDEQ